MDLLHVTCDIDLMDRDSNKVGWKKQKITLEMSKTGQSVIVTANMQETSEFRITFYEKNK